MKHSPSHIESQLSMRILSLNYESQIDLYLIFLFLSPVLRIHFADSHLNEFPRGQDHDDLWLFEKVQEPQTESKEMSSTEGKKDFEERLVQLFDGQMSTLESKSSTDSTKRTNVPIVMIGNEIPKCIRATTINVYQTTLSKSTATTKRRKKNFPRGCIKRRICQNIEFQMQDKMKTNLSVNYNTTRLNSV